MSPGRTVPGSGVVRAASGSGTGPRDRPRSVPRVRALGVCALGVCVRAGRFGARSSAGACGSGRQVGAGHSDTLGGLRPVRCGAASGRGAPSPPGPVWRVPGDRRSLGSTGRLASSPCGSPRCSGRGPLGSWVAPARTDGSTPATRSRPIMSSMTPGVVPGPSRGGAGTGGGEHGDRVVDGQRAGVEVGGCQAESRSATAFGWRSSEVIDPLSDEPEEGAGGVGPVGLREERCEGVPHVGETLVVTGEEP